SLRCGRRASSSATTRQPGGSRPGDGQLRGGALGSVGSANRGFSSGQKAGGAQRPCPRASEGRSDLERGAGGGDLRLWNHLSTRGGRASGGHAGASSPAPRREVAG